MPVTFFAHLCTIQKMHENERFWETINRQNEKTLDLIKGNNEVETENKLYGQMLLKGNRMLKLPNKGIATFYLL